MSESVIIEAVRTPFGKRGGAYREVRPDSLLAFTLNSLLGRAGVTPDRIDDVMCGTVTQAGEQGANVGRLAVLNAGFPVRVPAVSMNRLCGSSQQALHFASQAVAAGDARFTIACGVENMTRVPMMSDIEPSGQFRGFEMLNPELLRRHELVHQGESAERIADKWKLSRAELDDYSIESHRRAWAAASAGLHAELIATPGLNDAGQTMQLSRDEGVRQQVDKAKMGTLKTVFRPDSGVVTAGNASQISDGAAAVLIADEQVARAEGLRPRARFRARVAIGSDPTLQLTGPIEATQLALKRAGLNIGDLDWIEINEAFASVVLAWAREIRPDMDKVNPWGGAIAHGHPLGATGAGLMAKMLAGLEATGGTLGLQTMCIGHGMATATIIERLR
jgi:acetyl-CoA acetyltransferase family protein